MKTILHGLLILLSFHTSIRSFAQEVHRHLGQAYDFEPGREAVVFADTANVRTAPEAAARVQDRLPHGTVVKIEQVGAELELNGKSAPWCTVSYTVNGARKTGQLWSVLLSPRLLRHGNTLFIYGMKFATSDTATTLVDVKALRHDSVVARTSFQLASLEAASRAHEAKILANKGLAGLDCLLYFYYSGEACAIPAYDQYLGWDGRQFIRFPQLESSGDAGVYSAVQQFIFPAGKGGTAGMLLLRDQVISYDEHDKPAKKSTKLTKYRWNTLTHKLTKQ